MATANGQRHGYWLVRAFGRTPVGLYTIFFLSVIVCFFFMFHCEPIESLGVTLVCCRSTGIAADPTCSWRTLFHASSPRVCIMSRREPSSLTRPLCSLTPTVLSARGINSAVDTTVREQWQRQRGVSFISREINFYWFFFCFFFDSIATELTMMVFAEVAFEKSSSSYEFLCYRVLVLFDRKKKMGKNREKNANLMSCGSVALPTRHSQPSVHCLLSRLLRLDV